MFKQTLALVGLMLSLSANAAVIPHSANITYDDGSYFSLTFDGVKKFGQGTHYIYITHSSIEFDIYDSQVDAHMSGMRSGGIRLVVDENDNALLNFGLNMSYYGNGFNAYTLFTSDTKTSYLSPYSAFI